MGNGINMEWLMNLQDALNQKDWDSESAVFNHVNRISKTKITDLDEINQTLLLISNQMRQNYPLRCFMKQKEDN